MVSYHRKRGTWKDKVDRYISLSHFARHKFIESGFPENKIAVKPNFYSKDGKVRTQESRDRRGALFVGRLSKEKGIRSLIEAWRGLDIQLKIAGDGPLFSEYNIIGLPSVKLLGKISRQSVSNEMHNASFLVMPSEWYEGFPMVLVEAFAHGLPVIASRLGSMAEIVEDGVTGLHFEAGNSKDLAEKVLWMHNNPIACRQMGENAHREYKEKYTPERNYKLLMNIYEKAIKEKTSKKKRL